MSYKLTCGKCGVDICIRNLYENQLSSSAPAEMIMGFTPCDCQREEAEEPTADTDPAPHMPTLKFFCPKCSKYDCLCVHADEECVSLTFNSNVDDKEAKARRGPEKFAYVDERIIEGLTPDEEDEECK